MKKVATKKSVPTVAKGTVAWLIAELQKFPADAVVMTPDGEDHRFFEVEGLEFRPIRSGRLDEARGEDTVVIKVW